MSMFNTPQNEINIYEMSTQYNVGGAHFQCMQSLNIKEWKLLELQNTQTRHPLSILDVTNF